MNQTPIGVVIIGRNEGDRLREAIESAKAVNDYQTHIVYVDSGSTDGSVGLARALGCEVVELDMARPFTAGRGRNEGFTHLRKNAPAFDFVQFIDGDCILDPAWISKAVAKMGEDDQIAVVCGRRRERYPEASKYNLLCDMEWNTPVGEASFCGGDALIRTSAFIKADGYDSSFAAGEEPELCYRLRLLDWKIWRLDAEMVLYDAAMTSFGQWWKRTMRSGSAYAQTAWEHWNEPERFCVRDSARIWFWALVVPLISLVLAPVSAGLSLLGFASYIYLTYRVYRYRRQAHNDPRRDARLYAVYCTLGKFPQLLGQMRFLRYRESSLIEYKGAGAVIQAEAEVKAPQALDANEYGNGNHNSRHNSHLADELFQPRPTMTSADETVSSADEV